MDCSLSAVQIQGDMRPPICTTPYRWSIFQEIYDRQYGSLTISGHISPGIWTADRERSLSAVAYIAKTLKRTSQYIIRITSFICVSDTSIIQSYMIPTAYKSSEHKAREITDTTVRKSQDLPHM